MRVRPKKQFMKLHYRGQVFLPGVVADIDVELYNSFLFDIVRDEEIAVPELVGDEMANLTAIFENGADILNKILRRRKGKCECKTMIDKMNEWGCDICADQKPYILGKLRHGAKANHIPFSDIVANNLIDLAIANARLRSMGND